MRRGKSVKFRQEPRIHSLASAGVRTALMTAPPEPVKNLLIEKNVIEVHNKYSRDRAGEKSTNREKRD